jgi:hypothetical protein
MRFFVNFFQPLFAGPSKCGQKDEIHKIDDLKGFCISCILQNGGDRRIQVFALSLFDWG